MTSLLLAAGSVVLGLPLFAMTASASEATGGGSLTNLGTVFSQLLDWLSEILNTVTEAPILLVGLGIFVTGAVIGLVYRLIRG